MGYRTGCALLGCFFLVTACGGDDDGESADAGGGADAAPAASYQMGSLFLQASILGLEGQGAFIESTFMASEDVVQPSWEESPDTEYGCKVFEYTAADFVPGVQDMQCTHFAGGTDQGTMQYTVEGGSPEVPPCTFVPGQGYRCIGVAGGGAEMAVVDATMGLYSIHDTAVTFDAAEAGRFVYVSGAALEPNNGLFPIVMVADENTIVILNPQQDAEACDANPADCADTAGSYVTMAGLPGGRTAPIAEGTDVTFALAAGGAGNIPDFTRTLGMGGPFSLDADSMALFTDVPLDGSEFTIGCDEEGDGCGASDMSILNIVMTDAPLEGAASPFALPAPETTGVQVQCVVLGPRVTVPAAASAYIAGANATRIRPVFIRANGAFFTLPDVELKVAAGHALATVMEP